MSNLTAMQQLEEAYEPLDPELVKDPYHPSNDRYYRSLDDIKKRIVHQQGIMKPKEVEAVKLALSSMSNTDIAKRIGVTPATASKYIRSENGRRLRQLIGHLQHQLDGPNLEHRQAILYRIAIDNEVERPNVSIQAITEINKMTHAYTPSGAGGVNVTINQNLFPMGELDKAPNTYESRVHLEND
jgi:hypothetical protein